MDRLPPPSTWRVTAHTVLSSPKSHLVVGVAVAMISLLTFLHIADIPSAAAYGFVAVGSSLAVTSIVRWVLSNIEHKKNQEALRQALCVWEASHEGSREISEKILSAFQSHATELDLSRAKLSSLPDAIASLPKLRTVHLYGNNELKKLPESVRNQPSLAVLVDSTQRKQFSNQDQRILNQSMKIYLDAWGTTAGEFGYIAQNRILDVYLQQQDTLHLSNLKLPHLPKSMEALQSVKTLNLDNNALSSLKEIQYLPLNQLKADGNRLTTFPKEVFSFQNMTTLSLSSTGLSSLPDDLGRLSNLIKLELGGNLLSSIPVSISRCTKLQHLNLSGNKFSSLPDELKHLEQLQVLDLSHNAFNVVPHVIAELRTLEQLFFHHNQLSTLPDEWRQLAQLQVLDLSFNQFKKMPDVITELQGLKKLSLSTNSIPSLPQNIEKLKKLTHLNFSHNGCESIPMGIGELKELVELNLNNNPLGTRTFPPEMHQLTELQELCLAGTQLGQVPEVILTLKSLKVLDLSNNTFAKLPHNMQQLESLECLYLNDNRNLEALPSSLLDLPKLRELQLRQISSIISLPNFPDRIVIPESLRQRYQHAVDRLYDAVEPWQRGNSAVDKEKMIQRMTSGDMVCVADWLDHLRTTAEYMRHYQHMAKVVKSILQDLPNSTFQQSFINIVQGNTTACGDQAGGIFNQVVMAWKAWKLSQKTMTHQERVEGLISLAITEALDVAIAQLINNSKAWDRTMEQVTHLSVDIFFAYHVYLKRMGVPLVSEMRTNLYPWAAADFEDYYTRSRVCMNKNHITNFDLYFISKINEQYLNKLLEHNELCENIAKEDPNFVTQYERQQPLIQKKYECLSEIQDLRVEHSECITDQQTPTEYDRINKKYANARRELHEIEQELGDPETKLEEQVSSISSGELQENAKILMQQREAALGKPIRDWWIAQIQSYVKNHPHCKILAPLNKLEGDVAS